MARSAPRQKAARQTPATSLFPFFQSRLAEPRFGWYLAAVYAVLMLAVGLKYHVVGDYNVETDFFWSYVPQAKGILKGIFIVEDFRGPAYPVVLALIGAVTSDFFHSGIVLSVLAASTVVYAAFELLRRLFRPDIAFVVTLLTAVNPTFVQYTYTAGTDMVFTAFASVSLLFLMRSEERRWTDVVLSALFAAAAYLTRYNGIYAVLAVPFVLLFVNPMHLEGRERVRTMAAFLGMFIIAIAPWGIYSAIEKGSFFYNRNYLNIAYEMFAKGKMGWDQYWSVEATKYHSLTQVILADPALFAGTVLKNVVEHFTSDMDLLLGWKLGVFVLAGAFTLWKERLTRRQTAFFLYGLIYFGILLIVFYGERFSMFLLPLYGALASRALTWPGLTKYQFWGRVQAGAVVALVIVIWTFVDSYKYNNQNIASGPREIPLVADWFRKNIGFEPDTTYIVARKPHIAYYTGMRLYGFPYVNTLPELEAVVRQTGAKYMYYGSMEAGMRPQFQFLLDPSRAPGWLVPLTYTVQPPSVLYRVVQDTAKH